MKALGRALICSAAVVAATHADAACTLATINSGMPQRVAGLAQDGISALLGCTPTVLPPPPGVPPASQIYTWGLVDGALRKQIAVQFDQAGLAASARYQEIPLLPGGRRDDNGDAQKAAALALMVTAASSSGLVGTAAVSGSVCTPATINPGAVQAIRPHMSPAAVSGVLGCVPTELSPTGIGVWVWAVPLIDRIGAKMQVAVAFDAAGAVSAHYQLFPPVIPKPSGNAAIRVEPPTIIGNWVPGAMP